jgi:hypothetical protein
MKQTSTLPVNDPNSQTQKIRRKRDFSQVVDPTQGVSNLSNSNNNSPTKLAASLNSQTLQPLNDFNQQNAYRQYLENNHIQNANPQSFDGVNYVPNTSKQFSTIQN